MQSLLPPIKPRELTRSESDNGDIKLFLLPGTDEQIELVGPMRVAQWLLLRFDSDCLHCVPRPRKLAVHHDEEVELDFWAAYRDGSERYFHLVTDKQCTSTPNGRVFADATAWSEAARRTGIHLTFVHETEIISRSQPIANFFRMLPNVQAAYHVADFLLIRERVKELLAPHGAPLSFDQITEALSEFDRAQVQAITCSYIYEGQITFDVERLLCNRTPVTWRATMPSVSGRSTA